MSNPSTVAEFLREALISHARRLRKAADRLPKADAVHDVRVNTRRLRSLISNFRPFLPPAAVDQGEQLKVLAGGLSDLRDLDVMLANLRRWRRKLPPKHRKAFKDVLAERKSRREPLLQRALAALGTWRGSVQDAGLKRLASHADDWPPESEAPLKLVAPGQLSAAYAKFQKALERARQHEEVERYHELRKQAKKLRYVLEFLADMHSKAARAILADLEQLQDGFGAFLDAEVAARTMAQRRPVLSAKARKAAVAMEKICRARADRRLKAMPRVLNKLDERRWKRFMKRFGGSE